METCVFETFRRHLPHLCDKTREAAPDIYDFEDLLEAAATEGLRRMEFGWLAGLAGDVCYRGRSGQPGVDQLFVESRVSQHRGELQQHARGGNGRADAP